MCLLRTVGNFENSLGCFEWDPKCSSWQTAVVRRFLLKKGEISALLAILRFLISLVGTTAVIFDSIQIAKRVVGRAGISELPIDASWKGFCVVFRYSFCSNNVAEVWDGSKAGKDFSCSIWTNESVLFRFDKSWYARVSF